MNLTWIDLCSGLGGFSQPAKDRGWHVIRVDIDQQFAPDIMADLEDLEQIGRVCKSLLPRPTMISASPVCIEFTKAGLPASWASNRLNPAKPDTRLTWACKLIIAVLKPEWWAVENVSASRKYLTPILGPVYGKVAGHIFWGKLPCLLPDTRGHKWRLPPAPDRAAVRSKIPYEIGETICRAIEERVAVPEKVNDYGK